MYPKELGYRMPAEFEEHERTFLSWPVQESMCHPDDYDSVCKLYYAELVKAIAEFEPVTVIVDPEDIESVQAQLEETMNTAGHPIDLLAIAHNDAWLRDNGPTFIVDDKGGVAGINWKFNAWGGKYSPWDLDDALAGKLLDHYNIRRFDASIVLEGGSIHTDGEGTLLTTEECLLNDNRNSNLSKELISDLLKQYLNIRKIIWLKNGLDGDETDGHIDNIACFAAPGKIILQVCDDPDDANYEITKQAIAEIENTIDAQARKLEIIKINQPPMRKHDDNRLTLSYLNFYFVNGGIILPIFGGDAEETDRQAIATLEKAFPDRKIRTIDGMSIIKEGGNVHCTTQQMPKAKKLVK
ncbi:agmatine deiminase family protein [Desulfuribacillus alkaliarsenatis]|uniref:Agmatine deiminase n=1 Tax=Desulfuribacillus alkaliarsenatis TaxID=766136 RepID=A0A1E5G3M0_9FIRM|nr:agmatine deiminase family protein [Desulfuribacillus alkaliarsenatis]OEF97684.1 agmatine deiminase [Desulfuribacillus alkaliarsenatis]